MGDINLDLHIWAWNGQMLTMLLQIFSVHFLTHNHSNLLISQKGYQDIALKFGMEFQNCIKYNISRTQALRQLKKAWESSEL